MEQYLGEVNPKGLKWSAQGEGRFRKLPFNSLMYDETCIIFKPNKLCSVDTKDRVIKTKAHLTTLMSRLTAKTEKLINILSILFK